ncbi:hypothetical protein [Flavobacterium undicola]|uniref:hypothetical protein n=1 Tax=Flavobacterium undicola TaxID=1932779 RepID=UPI001378855C|nr:hypothetical protein [Flavobacterium undicola]MBA0884758.1 hypothetical protein [Flavobacterium undicola]
MKKTTLFFLAYFDFDVIKRSLESFYALSEFLEIIVIENGSINSTEIRVFLKKEINRGKIHSCYFFYRNLSNNSLEIVIDRELKKMSAHDYFIISDGDLLIENKKSYLEIINIMDNHSDLFACGVSLDKINLPLDNFPESIFWITEDISEEDDYYEARTGVHLLMLRTVDFLKYWKYREERKESITDFSMANYCYNIQNKKWGRTKQSSALHLTWDSYKDFNHPYTLEKLKKSLSRTWNHKDYFSLVEYISHTGTGEKKYFIDIKRVVYSVLFHIKKIIELK